MDGFVALYLFMLAGMAGYVLISRVPSLLHTPLMSGSNFIHGVVLAGAMMVLGHAEGPLQTVIGFLSVAAAAANAVGGYVVTDRMLSMFSESGKRALEAIDDADTDNTELAAGTPPLSDDQGGTDTRGRVES